MAHMMRRLCGVLILTVGLVGCGGGSAEVAIPADAQKTASGISWKLIKAGTGTEHPNAKSLVLVHYTGWTMDGEQFDSSVDRGEPVEYPLNGFIPGWIEGLQLMVKGEKRRFWIPAKLAYETMPDRPQGMLVFDVELLDFK
jgi:FKBP-type peptidyl-prolyl cis-trans isomerase